MLPTQGIKEWTPSPNPICHNQIRSITSILTLLFGPPIPRRQCRQKKVDYIERSLELSEGLMSKALKDIRSGRLQEQRAALLYGIPLHTLKQGLGDWAQLTPVSPDFRDEITSYGLMSSTHGGEARLMLQKVAAWAEQAEIGGEAEETEELGYSSSPLSLHKPKGLQKTISHSFPQLRDALHPSPSPTPSAEPPPALRIPQVRSTSDHTRSISAENSGTSKNVYQRTSSAEAATTIPSAVSGKPPSVFKLKPLLLPHGCPTTGIQACLRVGRRGSSQEDSEDGTGGRDKDKQPRKKRGRYRQYDHDLLEEAITMVMAGRMSVSKAQGVYGIPHSTLEYKVKERTGTLKNPPKKRSANYSSSSSNLAGSGTTTSSANSGTHTSAALAKRF